jgi:hypothetical protein
LIIGLDNPEMNVNLYDINGDPMPGVEVTYSFTLSGLPLGKRKVEERGVARSSISGSDGVATYTGTEGIDQTWGSVNWFATPQTCPEQAFTSMFWFYSVDCDASTVEITPSSLFQNEVLQVKGTYAPGTPGASIQNAQIQVQSSPDNLFLSLQSNNSFYGQSVWSAGVPLTPVASLYNFYFLGSIQPCFKLGYPVFWKSTTPDCAVSTMQYVTTWSAGSASTVVTLHVSNSQLDLIPNVPFHFFGTTDPFTYDGTTDEFGAAQFTWPNSGSDLGTVTLGTTGSSCIKVLPVAEG